MLHVSIKDRTGDFDAVFLEIRMAPNIVAYLRQNALLLSIFGGMCVIVGGLFWLAGAGPVLPFMGIELVLLYMAYRFGYNRAKRRERLTLSGSAFRYQSRDHRGRERDVTFEPYWLKFHTETVPGRVGRLFASARGETVEIGNFLGPDEREEVAHTLARALIDLRERPVS